LPPSLDEYVAPDSIVRIIDVFVDGLDISDLGFDKAAPAHTGRPAYDPRALLKLYIYGYTNRIRSSRRLAKECTRNVEVMFLLGALYPDFRTIADFRKDNIEALKGVFSAFTKICSGLGLFEGGQVAIDGTKVRAQNARANAFNEDALEKKLQNIDERIARYLRMLDDSDDDDDDDDDNDDIDPDAVLAAIEVLKERKDTYEGYLMRLSDEGSTQILTTDPDAHRMYTKDGFNCCYNIQTAVDTSSHLISGFEVTSNPSDAGNLKTVADEVKERTGLKTIEVIADKGYESTGDILKCLLGGIAPHVAMKYDRCARVFNLAFKEADITEDIISSTRPEDIATCLHAGVLPGCYEKKGIEVEAQSRDILSCFVKNEDDTVTCPQGKLLSFWKERKDKNSTIYRDVMACRECLNRCTDSPKAKEVSFGAGSDCVPVMVYGSLTHPAQPLPEDAKVSPNYHNLDRTDFADKKVRVTIPYDREKLQTRMNTVEHPFGTIKWYDGAHYFLMRGKKKVTAEISLSFLSYNLRRALNMVGFERLMAAVG